MPNPRTTQLAKHHQTEIKERMQHGHSRIELPPAPEGASCGTCQFFRKTFCSLTKNKVSHYNICRRFKNA